MTFPNLSQIPVCAFTVFLVLAGCGGGGGGSTTNDPPDIVNQPPLANAGNDISAVSGEAVELSGAASDSDGAVNSIVWIQTGGPAVEFDDANSLTVSFVAPGVSNQTELVFELTVTDDDGAQSSDSVSVAVMPPNGAPSAAAGTDQTVIQGSIVQLDGTASIDPENDPLVYAWSMDSRPAGSSATLDDPTFPNPTFVADLPGRYDVSLVVSDGSLESGASELTVTSGTPIGGILTSDLILSASESPYIVTEALQIPYGNSLTSTAPVEILGSGRSILVGGVLDIAGNADQLTSLYDVHVIPAAGPNTELYSIRLSFTHFDGGSFYAPTGNAVYGSLTLTDSVLENLSEYLYVWYPETVSTIERNVFSKSGGISIGTFGVDVIVRNNLFVEQTTEYAIENWADYGTPKRTVVELNSFLSTDRIALRLPPGYTDAAIDGRNNYWNSTDVSVVQSMIFDENDNIESAGVIPFDPMLLQAHPDTPVWP